MHLITDENINEAYDAVKDILMMYCFMVWRYNGFSFGASDFIRFPVLKYLTAEEAEYEGRVDTNLLRSGSAVALLAILYDSWISNDVVVAAPDQKKAILDGCLTAFPDIDAVARQALNHPPMPWSSDHWFDRLGEPIYNAYVLGFFRMMARVEV
ncbi:hypothetical protein ABAC460_23005 [Asticcacaulis sp. AC460]|uniref:hypothetical protein n=1 Tax=Asticcacaulis sp. AC460 TaxID=1282360 RepID=UPI0003C3BE5D|nr:hypothetical protein [Asticcacaulis sp. AC460]ESQ86585.1 hypothetical protein ABAC460_23005 [Asticcacaulis sp. AC460]